MEYLINDYNLVKDIIESFLIIAILNSNDWNTTLSSLYEYRFVTTIGISVMGLIFVTNKYLYISLFLNIILSVKINKNLHFLLSLKLNLIYKKYLFSYASPLTAVSLLTYIKNHLPIIILGKEFELEGVAIFSIVKNFFKAMHTLVGSLTSKFVAMKNDKVKFKKAMNIIYYLSIYFYDI